MNCFQTPNKYALLGQFKIIGENIEVKGYNCYTVSEKRIISNDYSALDIKRKILLPYFTRDKMEGKTFLDLGASTGFYSIWSYQNGGKPIAVDMDLNQLNVLRDVSLWFGFSIKTQISLVQDWVEACDIVNALALIHWIYSCTASMGSLDNVIGFLAKLTKETAFIEWVDPSDISFGFLREKEGHSHVEFNSQIIKEPYNKVLFTKALEKYFERNTCVGKVSSTREIYVCEKKR